MIQLASARMEETSIEAIQHGTPSETFGQKVGAFLDQCEANTHKGVVRWSKQLSASITRVGHELFPSERTEKVPGVFSVVMGSLFLHADSAHHG
jgi:hypothetical protein